FFAVRLAGKGSIIRILNVDSPDCVKILLDNGANIDESGFMGTPLDIAAAKDNLNIVQLLLTYGATIDEGALYSACESKNDRIVKRFLESGADIDVKDSKGETQLHRACRAANNSLAIFLQRYGADITVTNGAGRTPLEVARLQPPYQPF
ncbi:MAG: hypothetical protein K940chlam6_01108, partial [Chlamydiae bacterium]|nr:hypothetical protein [Chlamydiota bacterium]